MGTICGGRVGIAISLLTRGYGIVAVFAVLLASIILSMFAFIGGITGGYRRSLSGVLAGYGYCHGGLCMGNYGYSRL